MSPLPARSTHEAHLYMDLRPCGCGEVRFPRASSVVALDDGDLASRYAGPCARCGTAREFLFRLPAEPEPAAGPAPVGEPFRYGGAEPSLLIDAGEWLWVADGHARGVPAGAHRQPEADRRRSRIRLAAAVAALDEVRKFANVGAGKVPLTAVWTPLGRAVYQRDPGRFRTRRLDAVRAAYAAALRTLD